MRTNESYWISSTPAEPLAPWQGDGTADIVIVGGGITGIVTAWLASLEGLDCVLLESHRLASSVTGYTTAKVTAQHGLVYKEIDSRHGENAARMYGQANEWALEWIAETVRLQGIDCDFERVPAYVFARDDDEAEQVREEVAVTTRIGLGAELVAGDIGLPFPVVCAERMLDQAQFHPRRFLLALADLAREAGVRIYEHSEVVDCQESGADVTVKLRDGGSVCARHAVLATHLPFPYRGMHFAKAFPHRGYVVAAPLPAGQMVPGMYISAGQPTRSVRTTPHGDGTLILVGGAGHKTGKVEHTGERYDQLEAWGRKHYGLEAIPWRWSTQDVSSADHLPFVGPLATGRDRTFVAFGFGGWGMTNGIAAARMIVDRAVERENAWHDVFDSLRSGSLLRSASELAKENLGAMRELVTTPLKRGMSDEDLAELAPGDGTVVRVDGKPVAVSRDEGGDLHAVSAVCTHMGCAVSWNRGEQSWDCPCHGSRFTPDGGVLEGPALEPLEARTLPIRTV
jgi:glycine/D-amino acid oxidase-like deaminating enzyme/nitrite reductase/ring-hydroxylating ferredoxin subunit